MAPTTSVAATGAGHLHAHQLLKIRALSDTAASEILEQYNEWYVDHGIEKLLAERLAQRDQKEAGKKRKSRNDSIPTPKPGRGGKQAIKLEANDSTVSHSSKSLTHRTERGEYMGNLRNTPAPSLPRTSSSVRFADSPKPPFLTPSTSCNSFQTFHSKGFAEDEDDLPKLKGACWPGMNMFDAATDEMKRMRNQRKDKSVIDQMQAFSTTISRDEFVYNLDLEYQKTRDVYASPSIESSPTPKPEPKKRGRKTTLRAMQDDEDECLDETNSHPATHSQASNGHNGHGMPMRSTLDVFNDGNGSRHFNAGLDRPSSSESRLDIE
ncbi:uncharacterized protein DNG_00187 [Cephalotrichum gorgonifer]|uniref:Uncharacterized protein n=1 Tax=Cephalotrichum gorgonifer TaxID=2041049 RepID=A0AAE8MQ67_9PEZI|nr:uncharacterized protein DNG_00187 [Cephalotrichum gorgonifer]